MDDTSGIPLNGITKSVLHVRMGDTRQRFEGCNLKLHPSVFPRLRLGDVSGRACRSSLCGDVTGFAWWRFRKIFHNRATSHHREVCPITEETLQDKLLDLATERNIEADSWRSCPLQKSKGHAAGLLV